MMSAPEVERLLDLSTRRGDVLRALEGTPKQKRGLVEELDVSRSTVDRSVRELEDAAMIEQTSGGYRRTACGRLLLEEYEQFTDRIGAVSNCSSLLGSIPRTAALDAAMLTGADVVLSDRPTPQRPTEELHSLVEGADRVRSFSPAVVPQQVALYRRQIVSEGTTAEVVLTVDTVERMLAEHRDELQEALATGRLTVLETEESLPYGLTVAEFGDETRSGLVVYGESGIHGLVRNDAAAAVEWGERQFEARREGARPLSPGGDD